MSAPTPVSGIGVPLRHGPYAAEVASVGATLRSLTHDGRDLVVPFAEDEVRPFFRGAVLVPWPNRVVDGRYRFADEERRLALTEPERGHALHGLAAWLDFRVVERTRTAVLLEAVVEAQAGYPHRLRVRVRHALGDDGLTTTITTTSTGAGPAPYGASVHPYLVGGPGRVDDWTFAMAADRVLEVDDRLVPRGLADVAGGPFDFASARPVGELSVDHAFTVPGAGRAEVRAADGAGVAMTWDPAVTPWVQVHTGDRPEPEHDRRGLAVEPMTCPPDAFNSGTDLVVLDPGAAHAASWTLTAI